MLYIILHKFTPQELRFYISISGRFHGGDDKDERHVFNFGADNTRAP